MKIRKIKRKINDKDYIHKLLYLKTKAQLKQICRDYKIKGFSKYRIVELVDFVHNSLTEEQLEKIFEIPEKLIYTKIINSVLDWELEKIFELIKIEYPKYPAVNIEKKDFKQIDVKKNKQEKRLDFTVSFEMNIKGINFEIKKMDFISILKVNQESNLLHQIYQIDFGDFPDSWWYIQFL